MMSILILIMPEPFHPKDEVQVLLCVLTLESWISIIKCINDISDDGDKNENDEDEDKEEKKEDNHCDELN